ncbi:hypothetical protein RSAG8_06276, partial [Rhizoctonia solani AG-8 WAC10335]
MVVQARGPRSGAPRSRDPYIINHARKRTQRTHRYYRTANQSNVIRSTRVSPLCSPRVSSRQFGGKEARLTWKTILRRCFLDSIRSGFHFMTSY